MKVDWKPIDQAPRDGTVIIVKLEGFGDPIITAALYIDEHPECQMQAGFYGLLPALSEVSCCPIITPSSFDYLPEQ